MLEQIQTVRPAVAELLGSPHPLAEQLGSPNECRLLVHGRAAPRGRVNDLSSLRRFLQWYHAEVLAPVELPVIWQAFHHVSRYELRELMDLDRRLAREDRLQMFAAASRAVGRSQLRRLRPLRDQRIVQRYLAAVDAGQAHGWHVVVYGLVLALFSLPLRQGLLKYSSQTLAGFVQSAAHPLGLSAADCAQLIDEAQLDLPATVQRVVVADGPPRLLLG